MQPPAAVSPERECSMTWCVKLRRERAPSRPAMRRPPLLRIDAHCCSIRRRPRPAHGIARLGARETNDAYATAMAAALAALARKDYVAAQGSFERAGRIRPGTPEVAEGLQQIRRLGETRSLAGTIERAAAAERAEQWSQALALYGDALKVEPTLQAAQEGVERAEPRAMIDAELQSFLDKPERLYSPAGRDVARNVLERAAQFATPGTRLQQQQVAARPAAARSRNADPGGPGLRQRDRGADLPRW